MKKHLIIFIISIMFVFSIIYILLSYIFLWPTVYKNNQFLDKEVNRNIKSLLLYELRDRYSNIFTTEKRTSYPNKGWLIFIDRNFMDSVIKKSENEYSAIIKSYIPDDWTFYYTIEVIDGKYSIKNVEIDP